jgi:hypothetical protein
MDYIPLALMTGVAGTMFIEEFQTIQSRLEESAHLAKVYRNKYIGTSTRKLNQQPRLF